jgi:hypothetical protein
MELTTRLLPDTPAEFGAWLNTLPDDQVLAEYHNVLARFLCRDEHRFLLSAVVEYSVYWTGFPNHIEEHPMPDWATDVVHTTSSGFYPTVGDLKRHLDGERPKFLEGIEA